MEVCRGKICKSCNQILSIKKFAKIQGGRYRRGSCISCRHKAKDPLKTKIQEQTRERKRRKDAVKSIIKNAQGSDWKKGWKPDLDYQFVKNLIYQGCCYCQSTHLQMTLDRIDNSIGHLKSNVVPACYRCNMMRGSMPYNAFLCLVPGIRLAASQDLFGSWHFLPAKPFLYEKI